MIDAVVTIFTYAAILLQGGIALHAVRARQGSDALSANRPRRRAGMPVLALMAVSVLLYSFQLVSKYGQQKAAARQRATEMEQLKAASGRALYPIHDVRLSCRVRLPGGNPELGGYEQRVRASADALAAAYARDLAIPAGVGYSLSWGALTSIDLGRSSSLSPRAAGESVAQLVLGSLGFTLEIFKDPIRPQDYRHLNGGRGRKPDLSMGFWWSEGGSARGGGILRPSYDVRQGEFVVAGFEARSNPEDWRSTGEIASIADLLGSQLWVVPMTMTHSDPRLSSQIAAVRKRMRLDTFYLSLGAGRGIAPPVTAFQGLVDRRGLPVYVFTLPRTKAEFRALEP